MFHTKQIPASSHVQLFPFVVFIKSFKAATQSQIINQFEKVLFNNKIIN